MRSSPARRTESGEHASLYRIHRPGSGVVGDEGLFAVGLGLRRFDTLPFEPRPQVLEGDGHLHKAAVGIGFRFFADAGAREDDFDVVAVELLQNFGMGYHGRYDGRDVGCQFGCVFADVVHHDRTCRREVNPFGCCREETFRFGGYQFRTERRFGYACETETLYCAYQPADRYVSEFAHIGGREGHVHLAGMFRYDELGPRQAVAYLFRSCRAHLRAVAAIYAAFGYDGGLVVLNPDSLHWALPDAFVAILAVFRFCIYGP